MEVTGAYALRLGAAPPPFSLPGTDGRTHALAPPDGRPLVVAFWCNHCPYVRAWERRFVDWAKAAIPRGVSVFAISPNDVKQYPQDDLPNMTARAKEQGYPFPYLFDGPQDVARAYGAQVTPHFFVFDKDRRLVYQGKFDDAKDDPRAVKQSFLPDAVEAALAGRTPKVQETPAMGCSVKWKG